MPIYYLIDNIDFTEEQLLQFKSEFFGKLESKLKVEKNVENMLLMVILSLVIRFLVVNI